MSGEDSLLIAKDTERKDSCMGTASEDSKDRMMAVRASGEAEDRKASDSTDMDSVACKADTREPRLLEAVAASTRIVYLVEVRLWLIAYTSGIVAGEPTSIDKKEIVVSTG